VALSYSLLMSETGWGIVNTYGDCEAVPCGSVVCD
jgi:hypothetical protein